MPLPDRPRTLLAALILTAACGGGGTENNSGGNANFTAKIDGASWTSTALSTQAVINNNATFTIVGASAGSTPTALSLTLYYSNAPGTYPLGVGGTVPGGIATLSLTSSFWSTPLSGAAGTVTISAVSATHITGTFSFTGTPFTVGSTGNKVVTEGQFDLPVTGSGSLTVPDNLGSKFGGTLGGSPWNAATVVTVTHPSSGTMTIGASNVDYNINLIVSGFTGVATYTLGTGVARQATVTKLTGGTTQTWGGSLATSGGTVTVTSYTQTRVKGSYNITLQPGVVFPGPGPLTLTGNFEVGLP
jgi:uncharacterized protein DUF6252